MKENHIEVEEEFFVFDHNQYCNVGDKRCEHLERTVQCKFFGVKLGFGPNPDTNFKCSECFELWRHVNSLREMEKEIANAPTSLEKEKERCIEFLKLNGWEFYFDDFDTGLEFITFNKDGCISVDVSDSELVFLGESGDFLHKPIDYFTLVGVLVSYRQLALNFVQTGL